MSREEEILDTATALLIKELPWLREHENLDIRDITLVLIDGGFIAVDGEGE